MSQAHWWEILFEFLILWLLQFYLLTILSLLFRCYFWVCGGVGSWSGHPLNWANVCGTCALNNKINKIK